MDRNQDGDFPHAIRDLISNLTFATIVLLLAGALAPSRATADPVRNPSHQNRSMEEELANCNPATGLPWGMLPLPQSNPMAERKHVILNTDWFERPDAKEVDKVYPKAARKARIAGRALVRCIVTVNGDNQNCEIVEEAPAGFGFGDAAIKLAMRSKSLPRRYDCVPEGGAVIAMPINFAP